MATTKSATAEKSDEMAQDAFANATKASAEAPAQVREIAQKTVAQAKEGYARWKSASEEASDAMEDAYATATKGYKELGRKSVDVARSNLNAHFDFLQALIGAKSVTQAIELQSSYAKQQFDVLGGQIKELSTLAQKAATESSRPLQDLASKTTKFSVVK